jgi:hypothetical protein
MGQPGQGLKATQWGQQAIDMDITGTLGRRKVKLKWLGQAQSDIEQYWDAN